MPVLETFGGVSLGWLLGFGSTYYLQKSHSKKTKRALTAALIGEIQDCQKIIEQYPNEDYRETARHFKESC